MLYPVYCTLLFFTVIYACFSLRLVALESRKEYLSSGSQQDAEEFLRALLDVLEKELDGYADFKTVMARIKGKQVERKKFLDNPPSGKCHKCGNFPSSVEESFLALKLNVPSCSRVDLNFLLNSYLGEQDNQIHMKCSTCCHCKPFCKHTGFCNRPAVSQYSIINSPHYLFIQLLRFTNNQQGQKVTTLVEAKA